MLSHLRACLPLFTPNSSNNNTNNNNCKKYRNKLLVGILLFLLLLLLHVLFLLLYNTSGNSTPNLMAENFTKTKAIGPRHPLVLGWTTILGDDPTLELSQLGASCPFQCEYNSDKGRESEAAMLVFHHREPGSNRNLPTHRQPTQLYVVWLFESPLHTYTHFPANFFNLTITYRMDVRPGQGVAHPYYGIMLARPPDKLVAPEDRDLVWTEEMVRAQVAKKRALVLWVASKCNANSERMFYVNEMQKHIQVDTYGQCGRKAVDNSEYNALMKEHFFYLAFENSICHHYITEKFWNPLSALTVPVVLSRQPFRGRNIPPEAFIAAEDFGSPAELAAFLKEVAADRERYMSYFNWTRHWLALDSKKWAEKTKRNSTLVGLQMHPYCQLCGLAQLSRRGKEGNENKNGNVTEKVLPATTGSSVDFEQFWWKEAECIPHFVCTQLLKNQCPSNRPSPIIIAASFFSLLFVFLLFFKGRALIWWAKSQIVGIAYHNMYLFG